MLEITIPPVEMWDEKKEEFVIAKPEQKLRLEHSLVSISKWERKYCKPYFRTVEKTQEETIDYIRFMTLTQNVDPEVYLRITRQNAEQINEYINAPMTAIGSNSKKKSGPAKGTNKAMAGVTKDGDIITSELIYYQMINYGIPVKFEKWHINSLLSLINFFGDKNSPRKKMSVNETMMSNAEINARRRKMLNSKG